MASIIDKKIANAKVNQAMDMIKNKSPEEIKRKLGNVKREDLIKQLNQIDAQTVNSLNIDNFGTSFYNPFINQLQ